MTTSDLVSTRPELKGTFGMVASTHWIASAVGMSVLEKGGNAFDAAVAAGFVLQVVEPHLNGPGGDMPAIVYSSRRDRVEVVCGQGMSPLQATSARIRDLGLNTIPGMGLLPATVPGAYGAWLLMLQEYGTWRLRDVLEYAIGYARNGYPLVPGIADRIAGVQELFADEWPSSAAVYLPNGRVPRPGELFTNPDMAATYERLVTEAERAGGGREAEIEHARRSWYEGFVADAIDRFCSTQEVVDDSGGRRKGLLTGQDMSTWHATIEQPKSFDYKDWRVFKTGPWGQGPVFLQQLALLQEFPLEEMDPCGADFIHTVVESAKLAFADRDAWYGCPTHAKDLIEDLLDADYTDTRRQLIADTASAVMRPGQVGGRIPVAQQTPPSGAAAAGLGSGEPTMQVASRNGDTCHLDVLDRWGNMVSATPSGGWLQSSPVIPGLGFCLGTRGQIFNLDEGHPNEIAPRKRPRTTLSPSLAFRDAEPRLAFGTPGGDQQDQWTLAYFLRVVHHRKDLQRAVDLPMFHTESIGNSFYPHNWSPGRLVLENRFPDAVVADLRKRGHDVEVKPGWSLGRISAVERDHESGYLRAAANARTMQGYAVGR